jgi:hypothetical protein
MLYPAFLILIRFDGTTQAAGVLGFSDAVIPKTSAKVVHLISRTGTYKEDSVTNDK